MKYIVAIILFVFTSSVAFGAFPFNGGDFPRPNTNSVGIGAPVGVRRGWVQSGRYNPPAFVKWDGDQDGKIEGRADTGYMWLHMLRVLVRSGR